MAKVKISVNKKSLVKCLSDVSEFENKVEHSTKKGVKTMTDKLERQAKMLAPVDTGSLKQSITQKNNGLSATVYIDKDYARYVEYGTSKMEAQPFMTVNLETKAQDMADHIERLI